MCCFHMESSVKKASIKFNIDVDYDSLCITVDVKCFVRINCEKSENAGDGDGAEYENTYFINPQKYLLWA